MRLCRSEIAIHRAEWLKKGYALPEYDIEAARRAALDAPEWVHFGAGNIFRALLAAAMQQALDEGRAAAGIVAVSYDDEVVRRVYQPFDDLCLLVTLKAQGAIKKAVLGSVARSLGMAGEDWRELVAVFERSSLKMASFTITEKLYALRDASGALIPQIERDFAAGPGGAESYLGKVAALCHARFRAGALPLSLVSMDNCAENGTRLAEAVGAFAREWARRGLAAPGFDSYVADRAKVGFPHTMIDKITPGPDERVLECLKADGLEGVEPFRTSKGRLVAPFVNAEEALYLIIEDWFPNGRPALDAARGVAFAPRETVERAERMKVCACLNPLHTALAVFGCLLGYERISDEMQDPLLRRMVEEIGYREGLPVAADPGVLNPREFLDDVIDVRLPNPFMPDTPQRIATDTSQKLAVRFGQTIKAHLARPDRSVDDLRIIPLVLAGWLRYAMGVDDGGAAFAPSDDPMMPALRGALSGVRLGGGPCAAAVRPILSNAAVFGVDLYAAGLGARIERHFEEMTEGPGAVRRTLAKYLP